jgi:signal transduction histidine kinase
LVFEYASTPVKDSDFNENERLLIVEVARRLEPRMGDIIHAWTEAIPLSAPSEKIPGMRRTLVVLARDLTTAFFHSLSGGNPQQALAALREFCERLIRGRLPDPAVNHPLKIADLMRAARILRGIVDSEIAAAFEHDSLIETKAQLAYARLWNSAAESLALTYSALYEQQARNHQDELSAARDSALEGSRLKSAFVANITHEIRTPLNVILGYADLMAERLAELDDDKGREYAEPIRRAGNRLLNTIGAVLDLSRIESGAFELQPVALRLATLVERHVKDLGVLARKKGIGLLFEIDEPNATVIFDEHCLSNSIINLLQNAIKFTSTGTVSVRVFRDRMDALALVVRDTGEGIDREYLPRLFEPFSQEMKESAGRHEGAGLGLALVKRYVEFNGARIKVESTKHIGTAFTITFAEEAEDRLAD